MAEYLSVFEEYIDKFPDGMYDSRQIAQDDLVRLDDFLRLAIQRGSPLTPRDFGGTRDTWEDDLPGEAVI